MTTPEKRGFLRRYIQSLLTILIIAVCGIYPNFAMQLNQPPSEESAETLNGRILNAQKSHPNITLALSDGKIQLLDFPGTLQMIYVAKYPRFHGESEENLSKLTGCQAEIKIDRLKWLMVSSIPRIWSIKCDNFSISHSRLSQYYKKESEVGGFDYFLYAISLMFLALMIRGDTIDKCK
jgi:hypothetical protein